MAPPLSCTCTSTGPYWVSTTSPSNAVTAAVGGTVATVVEGAATVTTAVGDVVTDVAVAEVGAAPEVVDGAMAIVAGSAASALFAECASRRANRSRQSDGRHAADDEGAGTGAPRGVMALGPTGRRGVVTVERERLADDLSDGCRRLLRTGTTSLEASQPFELVSTNVVGHGLHPIPTTSEPHERDVGASCESQGR